MLVHDIVNHNLQNRTIALVENGSWAPTAGGLMRAEFQKLKGCTILDETLDHQVLPQGEPAGHDERAGSGDLWQHRIDPQRPPSMRRPSLSSRTRCSRFRTACYVLTARDGEKDNGCIINTVMQQTDTPKRISITVNKANYTLRHDQAKTGVFNVSVLSQDAPFAMFQHYGFQSGRDADKFADAEDHSARHQRRILCPVLHEGIFLRQGRADASSLSTHMLFIADVTEARELSSVPAMTYSLLL